MPLYWILTLSCLSNEPEATKKAVQSKPVEVALGIPPSPIEKEITQSELVKYFECMSELEESQQQHLTAALNLATPPCEPCFNEKSYAECLVGEFECEIISLHEERLCRQAANGDSYDQLLALLQFQDLWVPFSDHETIPRTFVVVINHQKSVMGYLEQLFNGVSVDDFAVLIYDHSNDVLYDFSSLKDGHKMSKMMKASEGDDTMSLWKVASESWMMNVKQELQKFEHRSFPTLYIGGYRMRGMQGNSNVQYLIERATDQVK